MRFALVCLFGLMCCAGTAAAQQAARNYRADIALNIDAQGRVTQATPSKDLPSALVAPVQGAVAHWRFQPPQRNGVAMTARTYARVTVELVPKGGDEYGVRVNYLSHGPSLTLTRLPVYPPAMLRLRGEGTVYMEALVRPDGSVADIRLKDSKISASTVGPSQHAAKVFARVAQDAMERMQAKPEWIDGEPVASAITLPITFLMGGGPSTEAATGSVVGAVSGIAD